MAGSGAPAPSGRLDAIARMRVVRRLAALLRIVRRDSDWTGSRQLFGVRELAPAAPAKLPGRTTVRSVPLGLLRS